MAFDYLCFFSNGANHQADLAIGNFGVNPFKNSDFDPNIYIDTMGCLLYTSPSPRDRQKSRMPSSA